MIYEPSPRRYEGISYRPCGRSGLRLPAISLGLWQNFGDDACFENQRTMLRRAFDLGITHFDLANNYGNPYGSAETNFGRVLANDFRNHREELVISTKAGWDMWPGPYGNGGSRKYLVTSLDQSLKRMGLEYVDIFYHHRPDPETPMEETLQALDHIVRSGRALYIGISQYPADDARQAIKFLRQLGTPCLVHQPSYSLLDRWIEDALVDVLAAEGVGAVVFSPLAQGLLTDRYLGGIPADSRAARGQFLSAEDLNDRRLAQLQGLRELAAERGQSLACMALAWVLRIPTVTSALIGASRVAHLEEAVQALGSAPFSREEEARINAILA